MPQTIVTKSFRVTIAKEIAREWGCSLATACPCPFMAG